MGAKFVSVPFITSNTDEHVAQIGHTVEYSTHSRDSAQKSEAFRLT